MALYLDTTGNKTAAIAICGRCSTKVPYDVLKADGDKPSLRVCPDCRDLIDAWRLTPRASEDITLQYPRPDEPLSA